jgi:hypothetical protein
MLRKKWAVALVAAAGATSMFAVAGSADAASGGSWQVKAHLPAAAETDVLDNITAAGPNTVLAFEVPAPLGTAGKSIAWKLSGGAWTKVSLPGTGAQVTAVSASSAGDVWAFRSTSNLRDEQALHWNGSDWALVSTLPDYDIADAIVLSPDNVWAFGAQHGAWHYNGRSWSQVPGGTGLTSGSALSPTSIWAVGGNVVAHWNGTSWTRTSLTSLLPARSNGPYLANVYAASASNVYAITGGDPELTGGGPIYILHWNGKTWSRVASAPHTGNASAVTGDGSSGIWLAVGPEEAPYGVTEALLHYSNGQLTKTSLPASLGVAWVSALSQVPGSKDIVAGTQSVTGHAQTILQYTP